MTKTKTGHGLRGILSRLRKDVAGNTLFIVAAAMIPLLGMVGGAVDLSRLYMTKVRLQHACDAGVLAGRKEMAGGSWDTDAQNSANQYFWANFKNGSYGTGTATPTFSSTGNNVHGVATTTVPMTIMTAFKAPVSTITVQCDSAMQLPNTDVMFVLDNTGSMSQLPNGTECNSCSSSKIMVLRNAVKCFYEALAQIKTNGTNCAASSYQGINSATQLRFGFVPYSSNVNAGQLRLPSSYFASTWPYQSRQKVMDWGSWGSTTYKCGQEPSSNSTTQYQEQPSYNRYGGYTCSVQSRSQTAMWHYGQINLAVNTASAYAGFNTSSPPSSVTVTAPGIASGFKDKQVDWDGCVEEMTATTDIDKVPNPADSTSLYGAVLPDVIYPRNMTSMNGVGSMTQTESNYSGDYYNGVPQGRYFCPAPAQKLQGLDVWTASAFDSYVDTLVPVGNTYHDVGLLWGGRLISPKGMLTSENAQTSSGGIIQRHVIFMTDGYPQAAACDYTNYGIAWYDQRTNSAVSSCSNNVDTNLTNDVATRMLALCQSIKKEPNTLLWVISFGTGVDATTKGNLQTCATDGSHYFDATDSASLNKAFQQIAAQITQLRLDQ